MSDKISLDEVRDALVRSGYLLESRLDGTLRTNDFYVETNSAYLDPTTEKSRELDLFAMKGYRVSQFEYELIYSVLLVEAINNPQPIAFITKEAQNNLLHREDIKVSGLPVKMSHNSDKWVFLPEYLAMDQYHHYCHGRVATQFCSFTQKKNDSKKREWLAFHEDVHFNNFQTLSIGVEYYQDVLYRSWKKRANAINLEFYYPVVVVQGELLDVHTEHETITIEPVTHLQYRRTSIINSKEFNYQIDVVSEEYFSDYLHIINKELETTAQLIGANESALRANIKKIISKANLASTYDGIKSALSYHY